MRKHLKACAGAAFVLSLALAAPAGDNFLLHYDTPDATHAWGVHDRNRPNPAKVSAEPGVPPSDAIVLFDGTEASFKANWRHAREKRRADWLFRDGAMECARGAGYIQTRQSFGDCQLHLEWAAPTKVVGIGQQRGNSGVFLMGNYEVQVLDSYETDPSKKPNPNPNYADGQAGAVYAENPPLVNPARAPGKWQTYDIVFHQPVWEGGKLVWPGSITVFFNGVLVQDHWEMEGLSTHSRRRPLAPHAKKLPLSLQDHGNPVRFRNIWIREIPSRYANVTHGGPAADPAAVKALRRRTAESLAAGIDWSGSAEADVNRALEVLSYCGEPPYGDKVRGVCEAYRRRVESAADLSQFCDGLKRVNTTVDTLVRNKVLARNDPFAAWVKSALAAAEKKRKR
ncbi:MAG: DUF1080 domain-containing protein [Kiritimatiellae bacterium]|nr:DUF1080 domain-containing protein [Kiritimatiellia bacterium]